MFWKRVEKRNIFQEKADNRFRQNAEKEETERKKKTENRDIMVILREMEDFCKVEKVTEFAVFTEKAREKDVKKWLRVLLNPAAAYYFRLWLSSYRRLTESGEYGNLSVKGGLMDDGANQGKSGTLAEIQGTESGAVCGASD